MINVLFGQSEYQVALNRYFLLESNLQAKSLQFQVVSAEYAPELYLRELLNYYKINGESIQEVIRSGYFQDRCYFREPSTGLYPYEKVTIELIEQSDEGSQISSRLFALGLKTVGLFRKIFGFLSRRLNHNCGVPMVGFPGNFVPFGLLHTEVINEDFVSKPHNEKTKIDEMSWFERWKGSPHHIPANANHLYQKDADMVNQTLIDISSCKNPLFNRKQNLNVPSNTNINAAEFTAPSKGEK